MSGGLKTEGKCLGAEDHWWVVSDQDIRAKVLSNSLGIAIAQITSFTYLLMPMGVPSVYQHSRNESESGTYT
jgi:hypothetical protein